MANKTLKIEGKLLNTSKQPLSDLRIEVWDKDLFVNDFIGEAVSDKNGKFEITFTEKRFKEFFFDKKPDIYFRIYDGAKFIYSTKNAVLRDVKRDIEDLEIIIDIKGDDKAQSFVLTGKVYDRSGEAVNRQKLIALDVDLRGAAIYRTIKTIKEAQDSGGFEFLNQGYSDLKGNYYFEFYGFQFEKAERLKADVIVCAVDKDGEILGRSRILNSEDYSDTGEAKDLDVLITKAEERTEYEILTGKLKPFLEENNVKLAELVNSNEQVIFTSIELDESQSKIQTAVDAESLRIVKKEGFQDEKNKCENLSHELLYGIGRQDVALDWSVLFKKTEGELKSALEKSIKEKIIKKYDEREIAEFLKLIHHCATAYVLSQKVGDQTASLEEKLAGALPKKEQREAFINAYKDFKGQVSENEQIDYRKFWNEYLPKVDKFKENPGLISSLLLNQQLHIISGDHPPLIEELQVKRQISSVTQLVALENEKWKEIIRKTGVPEFIRGKNEEEKIAEYSAKIQASLNAAYPTQKIAMMLEKKKLPVRDESTATGIRNFLSRNKDFDFTTSRISKFESKIGTAAPDHAEFVKTELKRMQRIFQVSPTPEIMGVLMKKNLNSAYSISSIPKKNFIQMYSADLGGNLNAEAVYQRAEHISALVAERSMKLYEFTNTTAPAFAYSAGEREKVSKAIAKELSGDYDGAARSSAEAALRTLPDYSELFGSPDMCECEHCRSVYSAAAYFIELLRFLSRSAKNDDDESPLDIFAARRPDLLDLPLTCENTNTIIPYIDLVNEVMEYYTFHNRLDSDAAFDTGDATSAELRANPQNFEPEAYRILTNAVYPFSLPYHQPLDVIRTYGDHLKTERYKVMKAMLKDFPAGSPEAAKAAKAIESEALGISEEEYRVLTLQDFDGNPDLDKLNPAATKPRRQLQQYFGFSFIRPVNPDELDTAIAAVMEKVSGIGVEDSIHEFLRRSGLKYTDLVELIKTRFINPHQNILDGEISPDDFDAWVREHSDDFNSIITLHQPESACDLNTTCLKTLGNIRAGNASSGITAPIWSKIHRFIRLWRKLGWKIHEVDLMLSALGENDITGITISKLSNAVLLNKHLKLPINQLATFWGSIDSYGNESLYKKLFLNKAVQKIDDAFKPDNLGNYLTDPDEVLAGHIPAILAAFRMSEDDLKAITGVARIRYHGTERSLDLETDKLNIDNLSIIYRYTVLSKALKLKVPDLCLLIRLFNKNPFSILSVPASAAQLAEPIGTFNFYQLAASIKEAGFKMEALQYIFEGRLPAESTLGLSDEKITEAVRDIHEAFAAIEQSYPSTLSVPLTTVLLNDKLSFLFKEDDVKHLIGIAGARQSFEVTTESGLAVVIPASLASKYNYAPSDGRLTCRGIMSHAERAELKLLAEDNANFGAAVDSLYTFSKTLNADSPSYSVITDVDLAIDIPDFLSPKFAYSRASGRLTCTGIMSDVERTALKNLSTNGNFRDTVDAIYGMPEHFIRDNFNNVFAAANARLRDADLITLLNRPAQPEEKTPEEKLQFVYDNYLPLLKQKLYKDAIIQHLAALIGLSQEAVLILTKDDLQLLVESVFPTGTINYFIETVQKYHRASKFINGFKLTDEEVDHFVKYRADFDNIGFKAISPANWQRINDYVQLRNAVPQSQALLTDVFAAANIGAPTRTVENLTGVLHLATGWNADTLTYLTNYFTLSVGDFKNAIALRKIYDAVSLVSKTGLSAKTLEQWAKTDTDFDTLNSTADLVKSTVKAKYEEADWLKLAGDLSDKIRENQKQALINYLLTRQEFAEQGIKDADGLFEYFLIDVQMGACMDTSRIVQANAAVQMFVNRCLLNLEKSVSPDSIDKERWEWMKNYRVWEVNRKTFLYPENWLEPEWRDDRSSFFKELESELTQNDITERSVATAFRNYLTKLNTVANLDICGVYQEDYYDKSGKMKMLHIFGRTHNAPYQFFYRTCDEFYKWSAWEKVQVDIRMTEDADDSGVHLLPVVWKNRLFIFWAEFIEKAEDVKPTTSGRQKTFREIADTPPSTLEARKYWEMRLAWSEFVDGKWSPKQLTKEFSKIYSGFLIPTVKQVILRSKIINQTLHIIPYINFKGEGGWLPLHRFELPDIQSQVLVRTSREGFIELISNFKYSVNFEKHSSGSNLQFGDNIYLTNPIDHNLIFSNHALEKETIPDAPFFYHDNIRTYFVRPTKIQIEEILIRPNFYPPVVVNERLRKLPVPNVVFDDLINPVVFGAAGNIYSMRAVSTETAVNILPTNNTEITTFGGNRISGYELSHGAEIGRAFTNIRGVPDVFEHQFRWETALEFYTFHHPYSSQFVTNLNEHGIKGLMDSDTNLGYNDDGGKFADIYNPNFPQRFVKQAPASNDYKAGERYTYYKENVCFDVYGANSIYNWELFFHAPLYIATRLSKNGKFEEAMKWFHYIFDPTTDEAPLPGHDEISRYWKTLPFKTTPSENLEEWFKSLAPVGDSSAENEVIAEWRMNPFKPFVIARNRPIAFMKNVVIKYVENLRAWGDSLFRQFTRESVNEALQLYVIANHILGPRPEFVPKRGKIKAETYTSLERKWDSFSNALVEMENIFPYSSSVPVSSSSTPGLTGIGPALYFCIPSNEKLMEHWDTIADRLYKIRHCMDIDGVERQLALFSPPIDPAMLINAAAQGLSLGSILSDLSSPPPIYRFNYLIQKANEFCAEVKSLGSSLLSALEKKDGEELGRLRASHETAMLDLMTGIKERQVLDAKANKEALLKSRETAEFRLEHYNALLSEEPLTIPDIQEIEADVNEESQLAETSITVIKTDVDVSLVKSDEVGVKLIQKEKSEIDDLNIARGWQTAAQVSEGLAAIAHVIPTMTVRGTPFGIGGGLNWGGNELGNALSAAGKIFDFIAGFHTHSAIQAAKLASYIRREQDWTLQANLAAKEIIQLDKQITSADIKIQVAGKELSNHKKQIENSKQVEQFLKDKFTNQELYQWMKEQLFSVYKQSYNMAYDLAKKAEKCYRYELGNEVTSFIQYGYWDNMMQGLCAGEKLQLALRQLEKSYLEENKRELELTKSVSMALLNPLALQELRTTGECNLIIPEELFDLDYQGHYFRRIKSVSLSLPCIAGPYTTINCTLRLVKNTIRINTSMADGENYRHNNDEGVWIDDDRFRESIVPVKAIATSSGQRDSGMFELNFRDERYLPFEGAGAISEWKIELNKDADFRQFDYSTISDLILHINYTAREDAGTFKTNAALYLKDFLADAFGSSTQPLMRMFSVKHEFPTEWHKFLNPGSSDAEQILSIKLSKDHFPFFTRNRNIVLKKIEVLVKATQRGESTCTLGGTYADHVVMTDSDEITMTENPAYDYMQTGTLTSSNANADIGELNIFNPLKLTFSNPGKLADLFLVFHYALGESV